MAPHRSTWLFHVYDLAAALHFAAKYSGCTEGRSSDHWWISTSSAINW